MINQLLEITGGMSQSADDKIRRINGITKRSRMLALNATIEANRVGHLGRGFIVVADEVKAISQEISHLTAALQDDLRGRLDLLSQFGADMAARIREVEGDRLADLAHGTVEIIDRNLYERSCDVRWWATDAAVVTCAAVPADDAARAQACHRLGVILDSYTVYLDLWLADAEGRVIANGRPDRYRGAIGSDVGDEAWFRRGMATGNGAEFAVVDIERSAGLDRAMVATYATAVRAEGEADGRPIGVLGIFFDWQSQAQAVVDGVRLAPEEKARSRCLLLDAGHRVIAASDRQGVLNEHFPLACDGAPIGFYAGADGGLIAFARTPGYETYSGLGWYGVIVQRPA